MSNSLPIVGLHHIARTTRNVEAATKFYMEVLGFTQLRRPPFNFRGAWLFGYGIQIHIIEHASSHWNEKIDTRESHVAFRVADMAPVRQILTERKIEFIERVNAGGIPQIFFHDPDGHQIEIAVVGDPSVGYEGP